MFLYIFELIRTFNVYQIILLLVKNVMRIQMHPDITQLIFDFADLGNVTSRKRPKWVYLVIICISAGPLAESVPWFGISESLNWDDQLLWPNWASRESTPFACVAVIRNTGHYDSTLETFHGDQNPLQGKPGILPAAYILTIILSNYNLLIYGFKLNIVMI